MALFLFAFYFTLPEVPAQTARPLVVAHRGASQDAPENTLPAFELAWTRGADAIEGDFHLTRDGHIVCIHDPNTKKVAKQNLVISQSTLAEIQKLDVGAYKGSEFEGTKIPTLAQVLATVPERKQIYVEIKCGEEIIPSLIKDIENSGLSVEQIVVISFHANVLQALKSKAPDLKTSWLCGFKKNSSGNIKPSKETVFKTLKQINAAGLSSSVHISEALAKAVQSQGYEWHVWTVNDIGTARRMKAWGTRSITTDVPGEMRKGFLQKSPPADR